MGNKAENIAPPANIILTNICPNQCKYCFASPLNHKNTKPSLMSINNFSKVLDFLERSGSKSVRLLGGEPMIHPEIETIFNIIRKRKYFENITIFTGGLFEKQTFKLLRDERVAVIVNINQPKDYNISKLNRLQSNLINMANQGVNFSLGFNIYDKDFDFSPILTLSMELGIDTLRICMANPTIAGATKYINLEEQKKMGLRLNTIIEECDINSIRVVLDCVIPLCMFSDAQLGNILKTFPHLQKGISTCGPSLDISPDLQVYRCFALSDFIVKLDIFSTTTEIWNYFNAEIDLFKWHAVGEECKNCKNHISRICQGGCLAYFWSSIQSLRNKKNESLPIFKEAYLHIKHNQYEDAIEKFEQGLRVYSIDSDIICDYVYTLLQCSEIEKAKQQLELFKNILRKSDARAEVLLKALICEADKDFASAKQYYRKSMHMVNSARKKDLSERLRSLSEIERDNLFLCSGGPGSE